jgi:hypothetical protein
MRKYYASTTNKIIREIEDKYTLSREIDNPHVLYNGSYEADEDPADYVRVNTIKAVRLA